MAVTACVTRQFKQDALNGTSFSAHTIKIALGLSTSGGTWDKTTATYSAAVPELTTTGGYTAGGITLPGTFTITLNTDTANLTWITTQPVWTSSGTGFTADCCMIYDSTNASHTLCILIFGSATASGGGTFTVTLPAVGSGTIAIV
jgi:hypothetical protein